eukprot:2876116-Ditylum_brightwellii.AAC.1
MLQDTAARKEPGVRQSHPSQTSTEFCFGCDFSHKLKLIPIPFGSSPPPLCLVGQSISVSVTFWACRRKRHSTEGYLAKCCKTPIFA